MVWTRTPHQYCPRARLTGDCPYSHNYDVPGAQGMPYGRSDHATAHDDYPYLTLAQHIESINANASDGGARAQVAALAVRRLVDFGSGEWGALVSHYGEPSERDWAMAQDAYGPNRTLPGWTYVDRFAVTESEARALDGNR